MRSMMILVSTLALAACNMSADAREDKGGSGRTTQQNFNVGDFQGVALGGSPDVIVTVGGATSVRAEGDADFIEKLDIRVENGILKIGTRKDSGWHMGWSHSRVTIHVTTPRLASAAVAGSGDMRIDKVEGDSFKGTIAGSGDMEIAALKVGMADFSIAGSGGIRAAGTAGTTNAEVAGSGNIDLSGVKARQASVSVVGSGDIDANASESANVTIMGSGDVRVAGGAKCTVSKRGSGDLHCAG